MRNAATGDKIEPAHGARSERGAFNRPQGSDMTQFNSMPPPVPPRGPGGVVAFTPPPPPMTTTSGLAVASLICALIFCFPFLTPLLAILFGIIALIGISRSNGRKRGTGLAAAGLVIGSLVLLAHVAVLVVLMAVWLPVKRNAETEFESFVLNVESGRLGEARAMLTDDAQKKAGRSAHHELAALLSREYGSFKSVKFDWSMGAYTRGVPQPSSLGNPFAAAANSAQGAQAGAGFEYSMPIKAEFAKAGTVYGEITFKIKASASAGTHAVAVATPHGIDSITLVGPNGPWSFPFPPAAGLPAPTTAPGTDPNGGDDSDGTDGET